MTRGGGIYVSNTGHLTSAATIRSRWLVVLVYAFSFQCNTMLAESIPVRHKEGVSHGFLALHTPEGQTLKPGRLIQCGDWAIKSVEENVTPKVDKRSLTIS